MYVETINYKDYDGNDRSETLYFNLTKSEFTKLNMMIKGGLANYIKKVMETQDGQEVLDLFDLIISKSYGEKSLDGRRFVKSPEAYKEFTETEAYNEFFFKLVTDAQYAAKVVNGITSSITDDPTIKKEIEKQQAIEKQQVIEAKENV